MYTALNEEADRDAAAKAQADSEAIAERDFGIPPYLLDPFDNLLAVQAVAINRSREEEGPLNVHLEAALKSRDVVAIKSIKSRLGVLTTPPPDEAPVMIWSRPARNSFAKGAKCSSTGSMQINMTWPMRPTQL